LAGKLLGQGVVLVLHRGLLQILDETGNDDPLPLARRLNHQFDPQRTLLISPFRLNGRWQKGNGPRRDRLIVAMAHSLVAVEVRLSGVIDGLCRKAQSLGRPVFVCPFVKPSIPNSANQELIEAGATPLVGDQVGSNVDLVWRAHPAESPCTENDIERRRALGQFFTPPPIARFMWNMIEAFVGRKLTKGKRVIDPACGEGVFLQTAVEKASGLELFGTDIDESLLPKWRKDHELRVQHVYRTNGLLDNPSIGLTPGTFDVVIGNPPFSGTGLKNLIRLLDEPRQNGSAGQGEFFDATTNSEAMDQYTLSPHERAILDRLARDLSSFSCWRLRMPETIEEEESGNEQHGLFAGMHFPMERSLQAVDYDRMAESIREWPGDKLLDMRQPRVRSTVQRLASTAIEVFFVERFVQLAKPGGMIAVIVPETILASDQLAPLRTWLMEEIQLHAVVSLPQKVFTGVGANVKTGIVFGRRFTAAERQNITRLPRMADSARVLPKLESTDVCLVSPRPETKGWSLSSYLTQILKRFS
jgi:hypothetical protein